MKKAFLAGLSLFITVTIFFTATPAQSIGPSYDSSENYDFIELARIVTGDGELGAEIPTYHAGTQRIFATNAVRNTIDVYSISNPENPRLVRRVSMASFGDGMTSVAAGKDVVVVSVTNDTEYQSDGTPIVANGVLVVLNPKSGKVISSVDIGGVEPDAVTFTPDGKTALVAIEGEPSCAIDNGFTPWDESTDYSYAVDPAGLVSIIDVRWPKQPRVRIVDFRNLGFDIETRDIALSDIATNPALDLEPEYIVAVNSRFAFVTIQEANAIAKIDLRQAEVVDIFSAGYTDRGVVEFDPSDRDTGLGPRTYENVFGARQPDTIAGFAVGSNLYFATANEGDAREWSCLEDDVRGATLTGDPTVFPNWNDLNDNDELGRLKVDPNLGDIDGDGDYDQIFARGGRSVTIFRNGEEIYDSGSLLETIQVALFGTANINGQHELDGDIAEYAAQSRSDDKGAEPEGIAIGMIGTKRVLILGLERMSALVLFDITNPANPIMEEWKQMMPVANTHISEATAWSPEGIVFIPANQSPNGKPLVITSYELSGSLTIHQITRS